MHTFRESLGARAHIHVQAILLVHWLLTTWGCIVFSGPYAWANFTILALGVWAVAQRDSVDAISMFLGGLVVTVFLDVIHISIFYPRVGLSDTVRFSAGMAILSLLLNLLLLPRLPHLMPAPSLEPPLLPHGVWVAGGEMELACAVGASAEDNIELQMLSLSPAALPPPCPL
ncbi:type-1 angiotensin II receptor-associated protein [Camelus ferus]|nr:type-1 angiotensin II receptor-associated protein [Camelus ferus]